MPVPAAARYQQALDRFRREGREPPLLKRMSELISLLDLTTTLSSLSGGEIQTAALLIVMGELLASRGGLFVRGADDSFALRAGRGLPAGAPDSLRLPFEADEPVLDRADGDLDAFGLKTVVPIRKSGRTIALLGLGPRADGKPYGEEEAAFLEAVAACAATPIENGLILDELRRANQNLSLRVFQLRNLFEISRELTVSFDEEAICNLAVATLMGQLMVSRCALLLRGPAGLAVVHSRGLRAEADELALDDREAQAELDGLNGAAATTSLPEGLLKRRLNAARMALVTPLSLAGRPQGLLAVGARPSGEAFSDEDRDFAFTLGRQAIAALENVRLHRIRVEKERQDRELQIAREIQQSLFPRGRPELPGFEVAAESRPCQQVGGDHYDFIPLDDGRLAIAIADVSGKGTPASILMASVHASLRALAGSTSAAALMARLNAFLLESTQPNRFVTLFYAELDPRSGRLTYINAGHVPPFRVAAGRCERLTSGGPVLGLLEGPQFETGEVRLASGDAVAMVTDGATEAPSAADEEFGDERLAATLCEARGDAGQILSALVGAVDAWTGPAGCADDLTVLVLKAQ